MQAEVRDLCLELGRLPDSDKRDQFLSEHPELAAANVVELLAEAVRIAVRVNVPESLILAEAALFIAERLNDKDSLARSLRAKANAMWFKGDCKSAVDLFTRAADLFQLVGKMDEVGRTLSSSIQSLALLGEYERAFAAASEARTIFNQLGDTLRVARLEINVANLFHRQNRFAEALAAYEHAYRELLPHKDTEAIGVALHNMAVCLIALDDFPRALTVYEGVRRFCEQHEMPLLMAQADYNAAYLYYLRGHYSKALALLSSARATCLENGDTYHLGLCDLDQSEIYLELRLVGEAAEMAENSLRHFRQLGMGFESARSLANLAISLSLQGYSDRALSLFGEAQEILRGENNLVWTYLIELYRGLVLLDKDEPKQAFEFGEAAEAFFRSAHMPSKQVLCLLLLTRVLLRTGEIEKAAARCDEALGVLETLDIPTLVHQARLLQGQIYESLSQPEQAYESYRSSRDALEGLRSSLQQEELKIGFMRNRVDVYTRMVKLCLRRGDESAGEEAFSHVEAAKSRTLRDLVIGGPPSTDVGFEESRTDRDARELRAELSWYHHRLEREQLSRDGLSPEQADALSFEAGERERKLTRLLLEAPLSAHVGAALRNSGPATLDQIREALGPDAALVEYFELDRTTYAAVVTQKLLRFVCLASVPDVAHNLRLLNFQLSKAHLNEGYRARFGPALFQSAQAHLRELYRKLITPLHSLLEARDLIIVPYGPLHSVPFHALFDGCQYLIDQFKICYSPSASIFAHRLSELPAATQKSLILGFGDSRTPFIAEEVNAVAAVVPAPEVLVGPEATGLALRTRGGQSRFIHIAAHGIFRPDSPMYSAIRLGDGEVNLYDLYRMNLPVELLTLSGCVTGANAVEEGDELIGLTRGLLYAGARSLMLSLWDVDDQSTSEFMKEFYRQLQVQDRKIDAFQAATVKIRDLYTHPYHWAPFKLIGRASSL